MNMANRKLLLSIFLVVFIDLLGFSVILPLLPYFAQNFGADAILTGLLVAIYAAAQLVGAPILGRLSDRYGRRPVLMISIAGNIGGFIMLALAQDLSLLFLSRLVSGLTGGNISVAQAYITDVTDEKNRAKGLGMIGAAFGLGFIIGPAAGGFLSQWGYSVPALVSAGISLVNLLLVVLWLPESLSQERRIQVAHIPRPAFTPAALISALRRPGIGPLLHTRFFFGLAFAIFQTTFSLFALYQLKLDSQKTGYILAYVGLLSVITQGFIVGRLTNRFREGWLILTATITMAIALIAWALTTNVPVLLVVLIPVAVSGGLLNTILSSAISKAVPVVEVGGMLGLSAAIESLTRVIAPTVGSFLLESINPAAPGVLAAVLMGWLATFVWAKIVEQKTSSQPSEHTSTNLP
jgi:DHA1 family tetracycline resistance protein-like MFS transporter